MIIVWPEVKQSGQTEYINVKPWFKMFINNYLVNKPSAFFTLKQTFRSF